MANTLETEGASSGHKLGQLVGDWFQDHFVNPMLDTISTKLGLYLDHRLKIKIRSPLWYLLER